MNVNNINDFLNFKDLEVNKTDRESNGKFGEMLENSLKQVNKMQIDSENMKKELALGEIDNLHDVSIASEKANIALQVTMSVRGKVVEAYKEIMRIQI